MSETTPPAGRGTAGGSGSPVTGAGPGRALETLSASPAEEPRPPLLTKQMVVGLAIFLGVLVFFLTQTRLPAVLSKFPKLGRGASARGLSTFGQLVNPDSFPEGLRWVAYGLNLWDANAIGMLFAVLLGGAAIAALAPEARLKRLLARRGALGAGLGGGMGLPLFMCSACSAPVSMGFYRGGAALETTLGMILGSALFNPVGVLAIFLLLPPSMGVARVAFGLVAIFVLVPQIARLQQRVWPVPQISLPEEIREPAPEHRAVAGADSWAAAARAALLAWWRNTLDVSLRLVPPMLVAGFVVGAVLQLAPPQGLSDVLGSGLAAVAFTAALGTLLQLPTLFEIPLVVGVMALGLGVGPATALLLTAPSAGPVTFAITRRELGWKIPALLLAGTFAGGVVAGILVELFAGAA